MTVMSIRVPHSSPASVYQDRVCVALYSPPDHRMTKSILIPMSKTKDGWKIDLSDITINGIRIYAPDDVFASQSLVKELGFEIEKTIDLKPSFKSYLRRAYFDAGDEDYDCALENCDNALSIKPNSKEVLSLKNKILNLKAKALDLEKAKTSNEASSELQK
jgi:hypothetical protein